MLNTGVINRSVGGCRQLVCISRATLICCTALWMVVWCYMQMYLNGAEQRDYNPAGAKYRRKVL